MKFYSLLPEVPGTAGSQSICLDWDARPLQLKKVHYELDMMPADDIICTHGAYLVTVRLAEAFKKIKLKGFEICDAEVTTSEKFTQWHGSPGTETYIEKVRLPKFMWLKIVGQPGLDDFGLVDSLDFDPLIVSDRALSVLSSFEFNRCEIVVYSDRKLSAAG